MKKLVNKLAPSRLEKAVFGGVMTQWVFIAIQVAFFPSLGMIGGIIAGFCAYMPWVSYLRTRICRYLLFFGACTVGIGASVWFWMIVDYVANHYHEMPLF